MIPQCTTQKGTYRVYHQASKQARILTLAVGLGVVGLGVGGGVGGGVAQVPNVVDSLEANCPPPLTHRSIPSYTIRSSSIPTTNTVSKRIIDGESILSLW